MFGMNAKDRQGLLEDVVALGLHQPKLPLDSYVEPPLGTAESDAVMAKVYDLSHRELKVRDDALARYKNSFDGLAADYSDLKAVAGAARTTVDALVNDLARALGVEVKELRKQTYKAMSKAYDARVGELLSVGELRSDPRKDPEVTSRPSRNWYTSP